MGKTRRQIIKEKMEGIDKALERAEEHLVDILAIVDGVDARSTNVVAMTATLVKEVREHIRRMREEFGW
ncbi:MAG: hypothetical protein QIT45_gp02 [Methanophagales virus PBV266]|uniref:Uncharacterized protein n=1 Tax=Methanophagales virus PBV266 TaxID=3071308 RepID=A0AA46TEV4_9VIRU|nr:MAG: hypothetical protein QIT45_gp02 [Methanophagales virus PBV266]UYL65015.1 MAG: hypothetical protein BDLDGNHF_00002 [Methanophagales virus PBV266]